MTANAELEPRDDAGCGIHACEFLQARGFAGPHLELEFCRRGLVNDVDEFTGPRGDEFTSRHRVGQLSPHRAGIAP